MVKICALKFRIELCKKFDNNLFDNEKKTKFLENDDKSI